MGSIGGGEILIVLLVALIVLGPNRLPQAARQVGRAVTEVRRMTAGFQAELRDTLHLDDPPRPPAPGPLPDTPAPDSSAAPGDDRADRS